MKSFPFTQYNRYTAINVKFYDVMRPATDRAIAFHPKTIGATMLRFILLLLISVLGVSTRAVSDAPVVASPEPGEVATQTLEAIVRHEYVDPKTSVITAYLLYQPAKDTPPDQRSLLIFLYGAGGSLDNYNFARPPYAELRAQLAARGYFVVMPDLGKRHFMNDAAKATLDGIVAQVQEQQAIPSSHVHVMGTSMGAGSSLAYAIHRPDLIRSVCAIMPMTDFAAWVVENPHYAAPVAEAYGGTYAQLPEAYDRNAATKNVGTFEKIPVMLVHGNADSTVQYEQSQRLTELLQAKNFPCTLYTAEGQGHEDEVMRNFQTQAMDFIDAANR